jgi:hypothetical protein
MSTIIAFLERAGQHAGDLATVLGDGPELDAETVVLLKGGDAVALAAACGARRVSSCMVSAPDNEPVPADVPDELPENPDGESTEAA